MLDQNTGTKLTKALLVLAISSVFSPFPIVSIQIKTFSFWNTSACKPCNKNNNPDNYIAVTGGSKCNLILSLVSTIQVQASKLYLSDPIKQL